MRTSRFALRSVPVALAAAVLVMACADTDSQDPLAPDTPALSVASQSLLECASDVTLEGAGEIDTTGGEVRLNRNAMAAPANAVAKRTAFDIRTSASRYMELSVTPKGGNGYSFKKPVRITIDYSRCGWSDYEGDLVVWQIDPDTKSFLEYMGGEDDRSNQMITFETDHLSTYSIAH